ncbi:hypothetical protein ACQP2P_39445 [Dactylosporangium sp. CA-139114]|uniref:hypothetical protein n=1 Tax=Dactylosporangium sp. CA-139114 TaxID=3239931 RepID=UPI003D96F222
MAAAAAALAVGGGATMLGVRPFTSKPTIDSRVAAPPTAWPVRGDLAADVNVLPAVVRAWSADNQSIKVLYAGRNFAGKGPEPVVVVAAARDPRGQIRIGWFTAFDAPFDAATPLVRQAETAGPAETDVPDLGVVVRVSDAWVALDLAAPGYTVLVPSVQGPDLPYGITDPEGEFVQRIISGPRTQVTIMRDGRIVAQHDLG